MKPAALSAILLASRMATASVFPPDAGSRLADWDIVFRSPAATPSEGFPIGNGRMGTMVWTVPTSIAFQINRTDNFTTNRLHDGQYIARQPSPGATDQLLSLASFSLTFDRKVFEAPTRFEQRLSLENAQVKLHAETRVGVLDADVFVAAGDDVLSLRVSDQRDRRGMAVAELSLWRPPDSRNGSQAWRYRMIERSGKIVLTHDVTEGKFISRYAIAVGVEGRAVTFEMTDPQHARLRIADGPGPYRVLLASAAAMDATDVAQKAMASLTRAMRTEYAGALAAHRAWWKAFWNRSFLSAHSSDGAADYLTRLYNLHLYLMASSSRGALPPKSNGSIWTTMQDQRRGGSQFWLWHTESLYYPLLAANQIELTDPYFHMYRDQLPHARTAAKQRWGAGGAYFPEAAPFDGPRELPELIATEFRDVLLGKKTRNDLSAEARRLGSYEVSLATLVRENSAVEKGQFSSISHILSSGSELALQFWWRWEYTRDRQWLAEAAYPLMKECAEFYMSFAKPGPDQHIHIYPSNVHESFLGVRDSIADLAAIRGLFPALLQASEILGSDALQRAKWKAFLQKLAPYPMGDNPLAVQLGGSLGPGRWAAGLFAGIAGKRNTEEIWTMPIFPFEDVTDDSHNEENWKVANYTYRSLPQRATLLGGGGPELLDDAKVPVHSRLPILAARLGRPDEVRRILPAFAALVQRSPNGMPSGEPGMSMVEGLAIPAFALQESLVQSTGGLIQLFPAWPDEWDAQFRLRTRGAFIVTASKRKNVTEMVEIESLAGETCHIENPWSGQVSLYVDGTLRSKLKGDVLEFPTVRGETLLLLPRSTKSSKIKMDVAPPAAGIQELKVVFPSEQVLHTQLGK